MPADCAWRAIAMPEGTGWRSAGHVVLASARRRGADNATALVPQLNQSMYYLQPSDVFSNLSSGLTNLGTMVSPARRT
jgi:hypothetical protein